MMNSPLAQGPRTVRHLRPQLLHCRAALNSWTSPQATSRMMAWTARVGRLVPWQAAIEAVANESNRRR